ncbi:MAG: hypothetical protein U0231_16385 [Nitrospiraceae bacterium]
MASSSIDCNQVVGHDREHYDQLKIGRLASDRTVTSLPITWAQTMVTDSAITGFTLPGMMEDPGCVSGD